MKVFGALQRHWLDRHLARCIDLTPLASHHSSDSDFQEIQQLPGNEWLGRRDSNPDTQIQSLQSYR